MQTVDQGPEFAPLALRQNVPESVDFIAADFGDNQSRVGRLRLQFCETELFAAAARL
jgi:hypothetical protein